MHIHTPSRRTMSNTLGAVGPAIPCTLLGICSTYVFQSRMTSIWMTRLICSEGLWRDCANDCKLKWKSLIVEAECNLFRIHFDISPNTWSISWEGNKESESRILKCLYLACWREPNVWSKSNKEQTSLMDTFGFVSCNNSVQIVLSPHEYDQLLGSWPRILGPTSHESELHPTKGPRCSCLMMGHCPAASKVTCHQPVHLHDTDLSRCSSKTQLYWRHPCCSPCGWALDKHHARVPMLPACEGGVYWRNQNHVTSKNDHGASWTSAGPLRRTQ